MAYGANGNLTSFTDPLGRQTTFDFYANGIDLQKVRQTTPAPPLGTAINQTVAEFGTYNAQHRPSSYADASRQTDSLFWNSLGQITTNIPPGTSGKLTQYIYTGFHYVKEINEMCIACNGCPCTPRTTSLSHDSFGRLSSMSDSEGYSVTYDYDALDRLTKISYPDQTLIKSN